MKLFLTLLLPLLISGCWLAKPQETVIEPIDSAEEVVNDINLRLDDVNKKIEQL